MRRIGLVVLAATFALFVGQMWGQSNKTSTHYQYAEPHKDLWVASPSDKTSHHLQNYALGKNSKFCFGCDHTKAKATGYCPDPINGPCVVYSCVANPNKPTTCDDFFGTGQCSTCLDSHNVGCTK
jgi:hypothetical protein